MTPRFGLLLGTLSLASAELFRPAQASALFAAAHTCNRAFRRHPMLANMAAGGGLAIAGDGLMQAIEAHHAGTCMEYDAMRALRFTLFRVTVVLPLYVRWLGFLENFVQAVASSAVSRVLLKSSMDCLCFSPAYHAAFFSVMALAEGHNPSEAVARTAETLPHSLPASWAFWMPAHLITFGVVPAHLRVAFVNAVALSWNACMSGFNSRALAVE